MTTFSLVPAQKLARRARAYLIVAVFSLAAAFPALAQTATPIPPTATSVTLNIPTNVIFTSTNSWMSTFAPVAAIGIGISIAIAVLGYLGKMIKSAFT